MSDKPVISFIEWTYPRKTEVLENMRQAIVDFLTPLQLPEKFVYKVKLCTDEAAANIIEHGGDLQQNPDFHIEIHVNDSYIQIVLQDRCSEFNPLEKPKVDIKEHVAAGNKGGLGIMFLKTLLDGFEHQFEDEQNHLKMTLNLPKE